MSNIEQRLITIKNAVITILGIIKGANQGVKVFFGLAPIAVPETRVLSY